MAVGNNMAAGAPLPELASEFMAECNAIADWWLTHGQDLENGGFWGEVAHNNAPKRDAPKSVILNTRILWFFSVLAVRTDEEAHHAAARRAYHYLRERFVDHNYGGVYWMLDAKGELLDGRKHSYAQAFAIYAFSAYYELSGDSDALDLALMCFDMLETRARDRLHGGYFEAYAQDWGPLADVRLSEKEDNSPKTMNTSLHVLEAFSGLCHALPADHGRRDQAFSALNNILTVYCERVVDMDSGHLRMFMSEDWQDHSHAYSFGHDIESSWLIEKAINVLAADYPAVECYRSQVARLAEISLAEGLLSTGGMADEYDRATGEFTISSWWVQAEAMVGFASRWAHGGGEHYFDAALSIWRHVQQSYLDRQYGEWLWHSRNDVAPELSEYKTGSWKAPYHNGRAMLLMHDILS